MATDVLILCNDRPISLSHSNAAVGDIKLTIKVPDNAQALEVKPSVYIAEKGLSYGHLGMLRSEDVVQIDPYSWEFVWKTLVSDRSPTAKIFCAIAHPSFGLKVVTIEAIHEEAGYNFLDPRTNNRSYIGATFEIIVDPSFLVEGQKAKISAHCTRYSKDSLPKHAKAPDTPCFSIMRSDRKEIPDIGLAIRYGDKLLFPLVHKKDECYDMVGLDVSKLQAGQYDLGVHMRCDFDFNFGHKSLDILTKKEYKEMGVLCKQLKKFFK